MNILEDFYSVLTHEGRFSWQCTIGNRAVAKSTDDFANEMDCLDDIVLFQSKGLKAPILDLRVAKP